MKKRILALFLCTFLMVSTVPIFAATQRDYSVANHAADALNGLGLFSGTGTDNNGKPIYELTRKPTRTEALVMLIRTLGKDGASRSEKCTHPFTDVPAWADSYVGYAYENGLSKGISATLFGAGDTAEGYTYLTFILRALGYSDAGGADFLWNNPFDLGRKLEILPAGVDTKTFLRADVAMVSLAALSAKIKNSEKTLIEMLVSAGAVEASAAAVAGLSVMDPRSDAFCYEQDDNFVNSGMMAWDQNGSYFVYAEQYVLNKEIVDEYHVVRKNVDGSTDILYSAEVGARISSLSVHQGKIYFNEDTPEIGSASFGRLTELDPANRKVKVLFRASSLNYYTWYDGIFYVLYTNGDAFSGKYTFASVGPNGATEALLSGLSWDDILSFSAYGQNGKLYLLRYIKVDAERMLTLSEYDLDKKTSRILLKESLTNTLFSGNTFYYSNFDGSEENKYTLWRINLDAPADRVAVGTLPEAGKLYLHKGKFYFRSFALEKLLSMDMSGNVKIVKTNFNGDSEICLFDHYALLPTDGLIVSDHCDADVMDLNTGKLTPYGAYLNFTFWRVGKPFSPGNNKDWHEEYQQTTVAHGKTLGLYFTEGGLVIEYALVNPTTKTVQFDWMDWTVTCDKCDPIKFSYYIDIEVAPGEEYIFSMVFPTVPVHNLSEGGFDYDVALTFDSL